MYGMAPSASVLLASGCGPRRRIRGAHYEHWLSPTQVLLYTFISVSLCLTELSCAATYDASAYANADIVVNALNHPEKVILVVGTPPTTFDVNNFTQGLYSLYSKADKAITSRSCVALVGWCAAMTAKLNETMSCPNGSMYNSNSSANYVFAEVQLCGWSHTTVERPSLVDLQSIAVVANMSVASFGGVHNVNVNGTGGSINYYIDVSTDTGIVLVIFGLLFAVSVISFIFMAVCCCLCNRGETKMNRAFVDRAINAIRHGRSTSRGSLSTAAQGPTDFAAHYNIANNGAAAPPAPAGISARAGGFSPREGADSDVQEMQHVKPYTN